MKYKLILLFCIINAASLIAQESGNTAYHQKIELIEQKIAQIKLLPKEDQKQYISILSDIENRKNVLKSLLKTAIIKRDKTWDDNWTMNYSKIMSKLNKVQLK